MATYKLLNALNNKLMVGGILWFGKGVWLCKS
jgi:hypothetical protein